MSTTKVQSDMVDIDGATTATIVAGDKINFLDITDSLVKEDTVQGILDLVPAAGGGWGFVSKTTASSSATVSFTGLESGYDHQITMTEVLPATDNAEFRAFLGITGPTYRTSGYLGQHISADTSISGAAFTGNLTISREGVSNATNEQYDNVLTLFDLANSGSKSCGIWMGGSHTNGSTFNIQWGRGHYNADEAHTAIQFSFNSGNIATGEFRLYKRANA